MIVNNSNNNCTNKSIRESSLTRKFTFTETRFNDPFNDLSHLHRLLYTFDLNYPVIVTMIERDKSDNYISHGINLQNESRRRYEPDLGIRSLPITPETNKWDENTVRFDARTAVIIVTIPISPRNMEITRKNRKRGEKGF